MRVFTIAGGALVGKPSLQMQELPPIPQWKSLLVIKPSSLGDIVHGLQVVQSVARQLPGCRISWVVRDRFAALVEAAPFIDDVIYFHRKGGIRGLWRLLEILRDRHFDAVWDMQGLLRSGLMTAAANSPVRWGRGDNREGAGFFYTSQMEMPEGDGPHHAIQVLQEFPKRMGLDAEITIPLELKPSPEYPWSAFFSGPADRQFVMFTDSRGVEKEWPHFETLTGLIRKSIPGSKVAWCAGQKTEPVAFPADERFLNLTGCPLDEMIGLCRLPAVFIGNDSGPMHLSAAVGNPVLAIFGPTSPLRFGPWPQESARTMAVRAPGGHLGNLTPEAVIAELHKLLTRL